MLYPGSVRTTSCCTQLCPRICPRISGSSCYSATVLGCGRAGGSALGAAGASSAIGVPTRLCVPNLGMPDLLGPAPPPLVGGVKVLRTGSPMDMRGTREPPTPTPSQPVCLGAGEACPPSPSDPCPASGVATAAGECILKCVSLGLGLGRSGPLACNEKLRKLVGPCSKVEKLGPFNPSLSL